jgi:hypothetical protein
MTNVEAANQPTISKDPRGILGSTLRKWMNGDLHGPMHPDFIADHVDEAKKIIKDCEKDIQMHEAEKILLDGQINALNEVVAWGQQKDTRLQFNDCSRLHKLGDAIRANKLVRIDDENNGEFALSTNQDALIFTLGQIFVVNHDWLSAFGDSIDSVDNNEFVLPYPHCIFEFRVNDRTIILSATDVDDEKGCISFVEAKDFWVEIRGPICEFIWQQVRAICIALDAEIATHEVIRASLALNKKRESKGQPKLRDFHIVNLSRRSYAVGISHNETGKRKRLHFRRGHWRHYETTKTWIKWTLVGSPDLGFVDKHYKL